jgi:hypothetical protein
MKAKINGWIFISEQHEIIKLSDYSHKARCPLGDFFRADKQKVNVIGW